MEESNNLGGWRAAGDPQNRRISPARARTAPYFGGSARQDPPKGTGQDPPKGENSRQALPTFSKNFYGHEFLVTPDVLIPRPETERLIDFALTLAGKPFLPGVKPPEPQLPPEPQILDVGTGSGCIAITLKLLLPSAKVTALDISEKALAVARQNAKTLQADINFLQSDLLSNFHGKPDLIVANLPYVDPNWEWLDKEALSKEPDLALYAKDGGLELINRLINEIHRPCFLLLESDPCQHADLIAFAETHGFHLQDVDGFAVLLGY